MILVAWGKDKIKGDINLIVTPHGFEGKTKYNN